jgi:hypothetical protein
MSEPRHGLLLAMMEPQCVDDREFNEWYDGEHLPGRVAIPGFVTGTRFVARDSWPRYLVAYDLESPAVLESPVYRTAATEHFTAWNRRVLRGVGVWHRAVLEQVQPGRGTLLPATRALVVLRCSGLPEERMRALLQRLDGEPVAQARGFVSAEGRDESVVLIESHVDLADAWLREHIHTAGAGESLRFWSAYTRSA